MSNLLPPQETPLEAALDQTFGRMSDLPVPIDRLWDPQRCPVTHLAWLAWALSVDDWNPEWPEDRKRMVIAASIEVHRHKGTVGSIKRALAASGWGDAQVVEQWGDHRFNGTLSRDGSQTRAGVKHWALYSLVLSRPISIDQAEQVRRLLSVVAPARCHLDTIVYTQARQIYDATVPRDGTYTRGVA